MFLVFQLLVKIGTNLF